MPSIRQSIRSSTASKRPTSAIADGQIALNTASGTPGIFFKDSAGNIVKAGPAHYGATAPNSSPAVGGSTGNSIGEAWLDVSLTPAGWKIWNGSAWVNATPLSSDTVQGLVELATNAETQAGVDAARAVTAASLQSKVSDSISTTSASGIASSTAVKTAYDLANAALPKSGGIVTGNLEIGSTGSFTFEGSTADGFETTLAVVDPTTDRTITFPNITGTVVTTGDTGTVTSTMILDGTILDADINASAAIAFNKLATLSSANILVGSASGVPTSVAMSGDITIGNTGVAAITSNVIVNADINASAAIADTKLDTIATALKVSNSATTAASVNTASAIVARDASGNFTAGTITAALTGAASSNVLKAGDTMTGVLAVTAGTAALPGIAVSGDPNTGITSPGADQLAISTGGTGRLFVDANGLVGVGAASAGANLDISAASSYARIISTTGTNLAFLNFNNTAGNAYVGLENSTGANFSTGTAAYSLCLAHQGAYPICFATSNTERARITSDGKLGLGTSAPSGNLDVRGVSGTTIIRAAGADSNGNADVEIFSTGTAGNSRLYFSDTAAQSGSIIYTHNTNSLSFTTNATTAVTIDSSQRVGVGTSTPSNLLEVSSATNAYIRSSSTTNSISGVIGASTTAFDVGTTSSHAMNFYTAGVNRATLDTSGRLGIGTTSPGSLLHLVSSGQPTITVADSAGRTLQIHAPDSSANPGFIGTTTNHDLLIQAGTTAPGLSVMRFNTAGSERVRITDTGAVGIGTNAPAQKLEIQDGSISVGSSANVNTTNVLIAGYGYILSGTKYGNTSIRSTYENTSNTASLEFYVGTGATGTEEKARIDSSGRLLVGASSYPGNGNEKLGVSSSADGIWIDATGGGGTGIVIDRTTADGDLINFLQAGAQEGVISVSGTTVTYGGGHLARWSQLPDNEDPSQLLKGTVMSNLDEMCEWGEEDNEQLNKTKVSDVEGDPNAAGVFVSTSFSDDGPLDFFVAMTGDMIIRIAEGTVVQRGDLLMSAGDGTAKPQDDDIIRSKTIAKVTSTHVTCIYEDGSYCVPCVLMAC